MKNILIVTPSAYLRGGVETIIHDLCRELPHLGWCSELGLAAGERFHIVSRYRTAYPDVTVHPILPRFPTRRARVEAIVSVVRDVAPDIVVAARIADAYEAVARLKLAGEAPRLGVMVRGLEAQYVHDVSAYRDFIDACFVDGRLIERACIELAGMDRDRIFNLPGGVSPPVVPIGPRVPGEVLRIGYVGRLAQADKRVLDLIALVERLEQANLPFMISLIGDGPDGAALKGALDTPARRSRIRFLAWQTHEALYRRVFPELDCLLNFSPTEGVTIAPREGLVHGVVPVLSRFPGLVAEGIFRDGHNALTFEVGDMDAAARQVIALYREPGLLARLSAAAIVSQRGRYLFEGSMRAWADAFDACLHAPPRCGRGLPVDDEPRRRLERMGLPGAVADRLRSWSKRMPQPREPGDEWPHGRFRVPAAAQERLEALESVRDNAAETRSTAAAPMMKP
jgi:glycosyltransferase involved in cell wall biosynthesis